MIVPHKHKGFILSLLHTALAQSYTKCNPLVRSDCPSDPALGSTIAESFTKNTPLFTPYSHADRIEYTEDGVKMTVAERYDNPGLKSNFYIMFGRLEVQLKAAPGRGIVSSFYMQSDDLDEIDLEWIGSDTTEVQSNYFSKGNTTTYSRGQFHGVYEPQHVFHNYTIDWTPDALTFYVDGYHIRSIYPDNPDGYPQSPMYVVTGVWAGGDPGNSPGTIEWAGGETDFNAGPYSMYVKNMIISDYSTGSEYVYSDHSGEWTSIEAINGQVYGRYSEGVEEFSMLSLGGTITDYDGIASSHARYLTHIGHSSGLATRSVGEDYATSTENSSNSSIPDGTSNASNLRIGSQFGLGSIGMNAIAMTFAIALSVLLAM